jgi:hypothetical protein
MKRMSIYEPPMCCSTGLCGVSADPELLRVSTILNKFKKNGIEIKRFNLTNAPQEFVNSKLINDYLNSEGVSGLPAIVLDNEIVIKGRYPTNEEFAELLSISSDILGEKPKPTRYKVTDRSGG